MVPDREEAPNEYVEGPAVVHLEHGPIARCRAHGVGPGLDDIDDAAQDLTDVHRPSANGRHPGTC